jgi:hypothetical protein
MGKEGRVNKEKQKRTRGKKRGLILMVLLVGIVLFFVVHEAAVMYFADKVCIVCHEMKEPIRKWKEAGVDKNHRDCGGCHFDPGLAGQWQMNVSAVPEAAPRAALRRPPEGTRLLQSRAQPQVLPVQGRQEPQAHRADRDSREAHAVLERATLQGLPQPRNAQRPEVLRTGPAREREAGRSLVTRKSAQRCRGLVACSFPWFLDRIGRSQRWRRQR